MSNLPPFKAFDALAVTGTNTYRGPVTAPNGRDQLHNFRSASVTGKAYIEFNNRSDQDYENDVAAAAGATRLAKEAANTVGWQLLWMNTSDGKVAFASGESHTLSVDTVKPRRTRPCWDNATGTGTISDDVEMGR